MVDIPKTNYRYKIMKNSDVIDTFDGFLPFS